MGWIGGLFLMVAGVGIGLTASHRLRRRVTYLETCERLLQALWQEMSYTTRPLPDLWRRLSRNEAFSAFPLVRDTAQRLSHADFFDAFAAAVRCAEQAGDVTSETSRLLLEFAEGCGRTDLDGQQAHIEYYRTLLAQQGEQARRTYEEKGRVYRVLGWTGGIALVLLLT